MLTVTWLPKALLASNFCPFIAFICQTIRGIWRFYCFNGNSEFDPPKQAPQNHFKTPIGNILLLPSIHLKAVYGENKQKKSSAQASRSKTYYNFLWGAAERNLTAHTYPSLQMTFWVIPSASPDCYFPFARLAGCLAREMKCIWSIMQVQQELMGIAGPTGAHGNGDRVTHLYPSDLPP